MRARKISHATAMEKAPAKPVAATVCQAMKEKAAGIKAKCPQDCSGHGICSGETCYCFPGYAGEACAQDAEKVREQSRVSTGCPTNCNGHGVCGYGLGDHHGNPLGQNACVNQVGMGTLANSKHLAQAKVADAKDMASASVASATAALDGWANHASKLRSTTRSAQMAAAETVSACWASASATQVSLAKTAPNLSNVQVRTVAVTEKANASTENATAPQDSKAKTARSVKSAERLQFERRMLQWQVLVRTRLHW